MDGGYPVSEITPGGQFNGIRFDNVGKGSFVLQVPASCANPC